MYIQHILRYVKHLWRFIAQLADILHWRVKFEIFNALPHKQQKPENKMKRIFHHLIFYGRFFPTTLCYGHVMM